MDCIFCRIVAGEIPSHLVYEDTATVAFLDVSPASRGHTLVIPRKHTATIWEMSAEDACSVMISTHNVARLLHNALAPDGMNVIQNNGAASGQSVFHYHTHLIPRWDNDGVLRLWRPGATDHAALGALAEQLRAAEGS